MKKTLVVLMLLPVFAFSDGFKPIYDYGQRVTVNATLLSVPLSISAKDKDDIGGTKMISFQWNDLCAETVTGDSRNVKGFIFGCTGGGGEISAAKIMVLTGLSAVLALKKGIVSERQRNAIAKHLMNKAALRGETHRFNYMGYRITVTLSKATGYMITAERIE